MTPNFSKPSPPGDTGANIHRLFLQHLQPVKTHLYNFIRKSMNFDSDADDLFQETLLKGFRYFHSFDRGRSFKTWIFTIAHNLMKDHFTAHGAVDRVLVSLEEAGEMMVEGGGASINSISDDVRDIYTIAGQLKPRQREVFFLYYYNQFTVTEIVEITGLSRANIKFILHQARKAVKKVVEAST
ncbi:MAG: RNA polymerase sigma factor [bacterium]|nr:RNA polymerase sigma factor [bacterium]